MILAVDVAYRDNRAFIAGVEFDCWTNPVESAVYTTEVTGIDDYRSGQFFKRELPCILALLSDHAIEPDCIVIDGHVYLDGDGEPGLGKYLYDALEQRIAIIGVAKRAYKTTPTHCEIYRGSSTRPLFVTAVGVDIEKAKSSILSMHGHYRIPDLLKLADRVCRQWSV